MKNEFEKEYTKEQEIKTSYKEARESGNDEDLETAKKEMDELWDSINAKGEGYGQTYSLYEEARDCGNEYIDLHEIIWDKQVAGIIERLRENGIEKFTFSSTWSSAVETAWLFTQNGCTLEGIVEINTSQEDRENGGYEKAHGYLFSIG